MTRPHHILVPTDFSAESSAAKLYASMLADAFGATLHVLHVIPDPLAMGWGVDAAYLPQLLERTERAVRDQIDQVLTPEERQKGDVRVAVEVGSPVGKIIEYAGLHGIDLIVMGTHGRGVVERRWVGSVTQGVMNRASCPVVSAQRPRSSR
jgi:nucleotide-binding universal stress UspA family protein